MAQWRVCEHPVSDHLGGSRIWPLVASPHRGFSHHQIRTQCTPSARADSHIVPGVVERRVRAARLGANTGVNVPRKDVERFLESSFAEEDSASGVAEQERKPSSKAMGYFHEAPSDELLGMFDSLIQGWRLDAALEVLRRLVQARREDVLGRVRHKDFLRRARDRKAVKQAFRFLQVLPREYVDARTYNMLVTVCVRAADLAAALKAADMMKSTGLKLDVHLYTNIIKACSRAGDVGTAFNLYGELKESGLKADCQIHTVLMSTCAEAMKNGNLERREQLVLLERAFHLMGDMEASNLQPDTSNWNSLISCAVRAGQRDRAFEIIQSMQENGCTPDVFTYSVLIDACGKAKDRDMALKVYKRALKEGVRASVVLFTSAIQACLAADPVEMEPVLEIYRDLERLNTHPDAQFYAAVIRAAGQASKLDLAFAIQKDMEAEDVDATTPVCSALIGAALYNKNLELATKVYHDFSKQKVYPCLQQFNSLLMAHARQSHLHDVINLVIDFVNVPLEPDVYTYTAILSACQRADEPELAYGVAEIMKGRRVEWDEAVCFTLLRVCYNRLSASWYSESQHPLRAMSPKGSVLLEALAGKTVNVPEPQLSTDAAWVDRAVAIYKHSLSCNFTPTRKVLDKLFACLRVPRSQISSHEVFTPFNMAAHNLQEVQHRQGGEASMERGAFSVFDARAGHIAKDAISMGVLPQFSLDCHCEVDMLLMPPAVAEVYVLMMFSTLKRHSDMLRRPHSHSIVFHVPPFKAEDVFSIRGARLDGEEGVTDEINAALKTEHREPGPVDDASVAPNSFTPCTTYAAHCTTSLGVVATLQRLRVWYKSDGEKGRVWIGPKDLTRWIQADHQAEFAANSPAGALREATDHTPIGLSISHQRRSIRLGIGRAAVKSGKNDAL